MYLIKKSDVLNIAKALSAAYQVYGPVVDKVSGQTFFEKVDDVSGINLAAPIPAAPPKSVVFPQAERIMSYRYAGGNTPVEIKPDYTETPKALFGLRSCDLTGIQCLDRFFLGQEFVDDVYRHHRKKMFIVTNTCVVPFKYCFCVCTDSGPCADEGYDLNLTDIGDNFFVEAGSAQGEALCKKLNLENASEKHRSEKNARVDKSITLFEEFSTESKAWISRVMNRVTTGFAKEEVWEYVGDQCFECGACSFVCPSCSCFNIADASSGNGSCNRLRTWDSCSYEGYSRMAGGHNPRKPVEDRRNKRFFCKLSYSQSKKYLRPGCVGCGRCNWVCPGDIGLPNVVKYIRRETTSR
ncbi:MAG: 4Fe-4S dicluster domain-containing protein [Proteobacteria bacterium]|nr:4Fe-4S dicluster domain-containing protein [Pseudomonadota bacterium]